MKIQITSILLLLTFSVFGQAEKITFFENEYNFGTVNEKGGEVTHKFYFVNEGTEAIKISNCRASCGCTTPSWTRKPVFPGDSGYVQARYNPNNRPGNFNKTITVMLDKSRTQKVLRIKGYVQPPLSNPVKLYKSNIGFMRFKNLIFNMGQVSVNEPTTKIFSVYNSSDKPITFTNEIEAPKDVEIIFEPSTIKPKMVGNIRVTYNATEKSKFGVNNLKISFKTDEEKYNVKNIKLTANVKEFFTEKQKNDPNRPILSLERVDKYIGTVEEGEKLITEISYTNTGQSTLLIRNTYSSCDCVAYKSKKNKLKPGQTTKIKVIFDSSGKSSYVSNKITIVSNDPVNPYQSFTIRAKVTPKSTSNK